MKKSVIETFFGGVVLIIAVFFIMFTYSTSNIKADDEGYNLIAKFSNVNGINVGSDVTIGGYKIGSVSDVEIEDDFFVKVKLSLSRDLNGKIPEDSTAVISSPGLMSDKVVSIEPGMDEDYFLEDGDEIINTQSGASLEQLLGQVIYSVKGDKEEVNE